MRELLSLPDPEIPDKAVAIAEEDIQIEADIEVDTEATQAEDPMEEDIEEEVLMAQEDPIIQVKDHHIQVRGLIQENDLIPVKDHTVQEKDHHIQAEGLIVVAVIITEEGVIVDKLNSSLFSAPGEGITATPPLAFEPS